ncbi:MAG TPA: hypothetical protein VEL69_05860, partial [Ktedonobacteraceae bacterium]|nr:hypothetical protein [Ktedonobacteraceae bacterium]
LPLTPGSASWVLSWLTAKLPGQPQAFTMAETQEQWYNRQAIEQLAQHIPFERDAASKSEQIEMLRGLVIQHGRSIDPEMFGFEARNELLRLGLWNRIGPEQPM